MAQLRIIHIGVDKELNSQVDFESDNLEESIYMFLTALGLEVTVTSDDEEGEADDNLAELEAYFDPKSSRRSDDPSAKLVEVDYTEAELRYALSMKRKGVWDELDNSINSLQGIADSLQERSERLSEELENG